MKIPLPQFLKRQGIDAPKNYPKECQGEYYPDSYETGYNRANYEWSRIEVEALDNELMPLIDQLGDNEENRLIEIAEKFYVAYKKKCNEGWPSMKDSRWVLRAVYKAIYTKFGTKPVPSVQYIHKTMCDSWDIGSGIDRDERFIKCAQAVHAMLVNKQ